MFVRRTVRSLLCALVLCLGVVLAPALPASAAWIPVDPYASYEPQTSCRPWAKPGTDFLSHWIVRRYGGAWGGIVRPCTSGGTSEHKEGRAFDWTLDFARAADRVRAAQFLAAIRATDVRGNASALGRRMGIMYVIWNDRIYSSYHGFRPRPYLSSGCLSLATCPKTLRHRDHVHISLSWRGARANTSFYTVRRR